MTSQNQFSWKQLFTSEGRFPRSTYWMFKACFFGLFIIVGGVLEMVKEFELPNWVRGGRGTARLSCDDHFPARADQAVARLGQIRSVGLDQPHTVRGWTLVAGGMWIHRGNERAESIWA
jgi:hypothetical protein